MILKNLSGLDLALSGVKGVNHYSSKLKEYTVNLDDTSPQKLYREYKSVPSGAVPNVNFGVRFTYKLYKYPI